MVTDDFVAVIDGSTSKTDITYDPDMRNGRYCMTLISDLIRHEVPRDADVALFCQLATQRIAQCYEEHHVNLERLKNHTEERMTCSAVVYSAQRHELWLVGDCQAIDCSTGTHYDNPKDFEEPLAELRACLIRIRLLLGEKAEDFRIEDQGREGIMKLLIRSCQDQNITYPVIDGFPIPMDSVKVIALPQTSREIVLASDGYPVLEPTLAASEQRLHDILEKDPLLYLDVKATKGWMLGNCSFDDRAYVRFHQS